MFFAFALRRHSWVRWNFGPSSFLITQILVGNLGFFMLLFVTIATLIFFWPGYHWHQPSSAFTLLAISNMHLRVIAASVD